ncbi:complex I subunit 5 family protein [Nitrincola sp. A-D6]|uniref:complex I subunit 5 family protein n=1 Tax=Nitrincola sp. A-D6 TaxID=1545442 RepID=UPI00068A0F9C|nr:complex I subunit 5 family protein [Nitrincola sp. A-D6]
MARCVNAPVSAAAGTELVPAEVAAAGWLCGLHSPLTSAVAQFYACNPTGYISLLLGSVWHTLPISNTFLTFTSLLWLLSAVYGLGYLRKDPAAGRFWLLWLLTLTGNLGLLISADIISFYTFFALMTFAAYGLVIHQQDRSALRAGRIYLIMALMGEMLILTGLFLGSAATGHTSLLSADIAAAIAESANAGLIVFCLFCGFGVKAGIPLLHFWLPLAHPVAPTPASAVLSGAMIKAGLFAWLSLLPLGYMQEPTWGLIIIFVGLLAAFGGGLMGVMQAAPKAVLAYSSISQMGIMILSLGCLFILPDLTTMLLPVLAFYALHHALTKGALFLSVSFKDAYQGIPVFLLGLGMLLPALSLIGVFSSGAQVKLLLKAQLYQDGLPGWLITSLTLSALATTALMLRFLWLLWQQRSHQPEQADKRMQLGFAATVLASALTPQILAGTLQMTPLYQQPLAYTALLWVPAITLAIGWLISHKGPAWRLPQGDLVVLLERGITLLWQRFKQLSPVPVLPTWLAGLDALKTLYNQPLPEQLAKSQITWLFAAVVILATLIMVVTA